MIGVAIVTCDRPDFFQKCLQSIPFNSIDKLIIIDDGNNEVETSIDDEILDNSKVQYVKTGPRGGVGRAKHKAIELLIDCDYQFLIEDDIVITNPGVFDRYIQAYQATGIHHMMFGYHGPANKGGISGGPPIAKYKYNMGKKYDNGDPIVIAINQHCVGAFCFYTKECLLKVGNFDLYYNNALEHIDHSFMIAKAGLTTPYWNWADIADSCDYLAELACSEVNSSIRGRPEWADTISKGATHFYQKHNFDFTSIPDVGEINVKEKLKTMMLNHG